MKRNYTDDVEKKVEKIANSIKNEYLEELEYYSKEIKELANMDYATMYEKDFKKFILPVISGELKLNDVNLGILIHNILQVTNSYYKPIKVLDDNGEVLFIFPPLYLRSSDNKIVNELFNYRKLVLDYKTLSKRSPGKAEQILSKVLPNLSQLVKPDTDELKELKENIIKMYKYYNLESPFDVIEKELNNSENKHTNFVDDDLFDYE